MLHKLLYLLRIGDCSMFCACIQCSVVTDRQLQGVMVFEPVEALESFAALWWPLQETSGNSRSTSTSDIKMKMNLCTIINKLTVT